MPTTKSAKKALRRDKKRTARNLKRRQAFKKLIKITLKANKSGQSNQVKELLRKTQKAIDKAAKGGALNKKTANRIKSRLMKNLKK